MNDFFAIDEQEQIARLAATGRAALSHWDFEGAGMRLIKYRENAVFELNSNGRRAALRMHRFGYHTDDELRSELQWMRALADAGVMVPNAIPTNAGDLFVRQSGVGLPDDVQIDLFEWIEGEQLGSVEEGVNDQGAVAATYRQLGELAAQVHNQAVTWDLPSGFTRHAWDADGLAGSNPFWGQFWKLDSASDRQTALLERGRDKVFAELGALPKSPGTYSMIHADFAPENVLVEGDKVRLIDFDDAGFGWHLFELATSLYFILGEPYFDEARDALIAGYRTHRHLTDETLEMLPLFFLARGFTYIGWVHTRPESETARDLTPMLLESACKLADQYLQH